MIVIDDVAEMTKEMWAYLDTVVKGKVMDNEFETEKPFVVTTADMLEIVAGGGNGVEYVDITGLMETAAKELREKDAKIERLRGVLLTVLEACKDVNSPDRKVRKEITRTVNKALKEKV